VAKWEQEQRERKELVKERERVQEQIRQRGRDRSGRQRDANDNARRVQQKRAANPNVLPQAVVDMFMHIVSTELWKWCDHEQITPTIVEAGLPPPQCLVDFLDTGGSADAHPQSEVLFSRDTLLRGRRRQRR
jgi:hypothetical protein